MTAMPVVKKIAEVVAIEAARTFVKPLARRADREARAVWAGVCAAVRRPRSGEKPTGGGAPLAEITAKSKAPPHEVKG